MIELKKNVVQGFKAGAVMAGIKKQDRPDLALIYSETPAVCAAVFTRNKVKAAPVLLSMLVAKKGRARAIIANSGNANACNGAQGMQDALTMATLAAEGLDIDTSDVFVASTGVIGAPMPMDRVEAGIRALPAELREDGLVDASRAIMTTDTFHKIYGVSETIGGREVSIVGMAKGSGMINPDMATMLSFVMTDAAIEKKALRSALKDAVDNSFNCITVDGDTSTNDCVIALANGRAGNAVIREGGSGYRKFREALEAVLLKLAKSVVKDGEGATKLVELAVEGAADEKDAAKAAKTIANSPLVKTALFAADANWGRIMAAAGRSGAKMDPGKAEVWLFDAG
ncbi:MAG: bifunctional glutamate N-acetyltransferase/amino-acid acetyltransferase ArgJ, partial [Nitrospirota bacterium]